MRASSATGRRGFVLPTTMLVITLVTVMLAAAFVLVSAEYRVTDNSFASARALALAQAGLQNYFSEGHLYGSTTTTDSVHYTFTGGYAVVVAKRLRDSTTVAPLNPPLWVVRAAGYDTVRAVRGQPNGARTIAQFAYLQGGELPARAPMVAANGVNMSASGGNPIDYDDTGFNVVPGCAAIRPSPARASTGLTVPTGGYTSGPGALPDGGVEQLGSTGAVLDTTRIDWAKLLAGEFTPDYINELPPANNSTYETHFFTGDVDIPSGMRRGLLVATGHVTLLRDAHWDGIIVAGDYLDGNGNFNYTVHGMIITGLNLSTGHPVSSNSIRRGGGRVIRWDWCYAHASISSLSYLVPIKNAWVDTWSTY